MAFVADKTPLTSTGRGIFVVDLSQAVPAAPTLVSEIPPTLGICEHAPPRSIEFSPSGAYLAFTESADGV